MTGSIISTYSFLYSLLIFFLVQRIALSLKPLNEFILNYELTNQRLLPSRRSADESEIRIGLTAFNKEMVLHLKRDNFILSSDAQINVHEADNVNTINPQNLESQLVEGTVNGDPSSFVHGILNYGHLDGTVHFIDDIYYIEPADRYLKENDNYSTIVFRDADTRTLNCTLGECTEEPPFQFDMPSSLTPRVIRPVRNFYSNPKENICRVIALADHTFMKFAANNSVEAAVQEITFLFRMADRFWQKYDFNDDGKPDGLRLQIGRIELFDSADAEGYPYGHKVIETAQEFLRTMTKAFDFSDFCLGAMFCHRTFRGGTLGLAPVAENSANIVGGVCERYHKTMKVSPNCLIVSREVFRKRFPKFRSVFTLIHEIGHTFGSPHDPSTDEACAPSDREGGRFIMSPYTLLNQQPNNLFFSSCSKTKIKNILEHRAYCFKQDISPVCGNMIVEADETCDCGYASCKLVDHCCIPADEKGVKPGPCEFQKGSQCSARDPCCSPQCKIYPSKAKKVCRQGSECVLPASCMGTSPKCPASIPQTDGVPCAGGKGKCLSGICKQKTCKKIGLSDCKCPDNLDCWVCCRISGNCWHLDFTGPFSKGSSMNPYQLPGYPCNYWQGVCNDYGECLQQTYKAPTVQELHGYYEVQVSRVNKVSRKKPKKLFNWLKSHSQRQRERSGHTDDNGTTRQCSGLLINIILFIFQQVK